MLLLPLAVAKQAKQLGHKLKLQRGLESDDEDEDEGEQGDGSAARKAKAAAAKGDDLAAGWGASKQAYYEDSSEVCCSVVLCVLWGALMWDPCSNPFV
jgi:hypothetical protein